MAEQHYLKKLKLTVRVTIQTTAVELPIKEHFKKHQSTLKIKLIL